jgi:rod shape-determining protein MreD
MKYLIYIFVIVVLAGLQTGLFPYLKFFGVVPNLLLLFVVGTCLQREAEDAFFVALLCGLVVDFQNAVFVGSYTVSFLVLALLLYLAIGRLVVFELNFKYLVVTAALAVVFTGFLAWILSVEATRVGLAVAAIDGHVWRSRLPAEILYNLVLCYPLYALATWVHNSILKLQGKKYRII